ncbi:F-box protein, partial [Legionella gratiana]
RQSKVRDLSGRTFENISGFEYAMWALDKHMWTKMLACLPKDKEGEEIKDKLREQYKQVKEVGVTYILNGVTQHYMPDPVTKTEHHFDFDNTILKELQKYVKKYDGNQWRTGVGGAQRLLPIHVVDEYCSDEAFHPVPAFKEQPKSSRRFDNWLNYGRKESWFFEGSKLGVDFAIYKGRPWWFSGPKAEKDGERGLWDSVDLNALRALCEVRTNDFIALENDLKPCNLNENLYKI